MPGRLSFRFALTLALFAGVVLLVFRDEVMGPALLPLRALTADLTMRFIHLAGMEAVREASAIRHPSGFAYEVSRGCMGLVPAAILGVSILSYPGKLRRKLTWLAAGIPVLFAINFARLTNLFYLGVQRPELFHLAHKVVWQVVIIASVFVLWLLGVIWLDSGSGTRHWLWRRPSRSLGQAPTGGLNPA